MLHRSPPPVLALVVPLSVFAAGCEAPDREPADPPPAGAPAQEEGAAPVEEVPQTVTRLEEAGGSGVTGEAMAMRSNGTVVVALELSGLPEEREYAAHIHEGTCAEGGPVAVALNPVLGLDDGRGSSTTVLESHELPPEGTRFVQVHGEGGTPIACGDVEEEPNG